MGGPLASAQRHGELRREPALSGRPANPPPPSGESEEEGGDAEGDASPAPAPQPMTYLRSMGGPLALLTGQVLRDCAPKRHGELRRELALSGRPPGLRPTAVGTPPAPGLAPRA